MEPDTTGQEMQEKVTSFIAKLRSENTRNIARQIVEFLLKRLDYNDDGSNGWTRSWEIFNEMKNTNPNPYTITRLLRDLTAAGIIERHECSRIRGRPGKKPVFYRVPSSFNSDIFDSREELLARLKSAHESIKYFSGNLELAHAIYTEETGKDLRPLIQARIKEKIIQQASEQKKVVEEPDPCKSLS